MLALPGANGSAHINIFRKGLGYRSPIFVIFPNRSLPPLEWLRGVKRSAYKNVHQEPVITPYTMFFLWPMETK